MPTNLPNKRRRIMRALKLEEISGVDVPAQAGAVVTIMKRNGVTHMDTPQTFEQAVEIVQKRDPSLTRCGAMTAARREWPDLVAKYQTEGIAIQTMHEEIAKADREEREAPARAFETRVTEIQARDRCSRLQALQKAAREMPPEQFEKYSRGMETG